MQLILDARETNLNKELCIIKCPFTTQQLPVGDIVFQNETTDTPVVIIERKTGSDFLSSVKSGRYAEQRERLKPLLQLGIRVIYIVEGYHLVSNTTSLFTKARATDLATISGAIENLVLYHGIYVVPTLSLSHTAKTLNSMLKKLTEKPLLSIDGQNENGGVVTLVQKKEKVLENIHEQQMLIIPGVSPTVVKVIREKYPTLRTLIKAYDELETTVEKETLLANMLVGKKKLGKILSKRIYDIYST